MTTNWCGDRDDWGGGCFDHGFSHHRFRFDHRFDHHFDHHGFFFNRGGFVIIIF